MTTYDAAVQTLVFIADKVTEAELSLDAMKTAAKSGDWEALLAYHGLPKLAKRPG